jgi:hypothetical protein
MVGLAAEPSTEFLLTALARLRIPNRPRARGLLPLLRIDIGDVIVRMDPAPCIGIVKPNLGFPISYFERPPHPLATGLKASASVRMHCGAWPARIPLQTSSTIFGVRVTPCRCIFCKAAQKSKARSGDLQTNR